MFRRGLSARLERHMERGEELMELNRRAAERNEAAFERNEAAFDRNTEAFERNREAFERVMKALDRHEQLFEDARGSNEDLRLFIREMNLRNEKVVQQIVRDHEDFMRDLLARDRTADERTQKIILSLDEAREESKAHREALLALIDR